MSFLIAPLAVWFDYPNVGVTHLVAANDGEALAVALENGNIWILSRVPVTNDIKQFTLAPRILLIGHRDKICVLEFFTLETETDVLSRKEPEDNVLVSASADGEIAVWDVSDGKCLAQRANVFPGRPRSICMTSRRKHLIVSGEFNRIFILDAKTLDTVRVLDDFQDWTAAMCTEKSGNPNFLFILTASFGNQLQLSLLDEEILDFTVNLCEPIQMDLEGWCPTLHMSACRFDPRMVMIVTKSRCVIAYVEQNKTLSSLGQIEPPFGRSWAGGHWLSARTLVLWTASGVSCVYFFGKVDVDSPEIALVADMEGFVGTRSISNVKPNLESNPPICICTMTAEDQQVSAYPVTNDDDDTICCALPEPKSLGRWSLIAFKTIFDESRVKILVWRWWSSLSKLALKVRVPNAQALNSIQLSPIIHVPFRQFWPLASPDGSRITAAALVMERYLALGYDDGNISLVPLSHLLFHSPHQEFSPSVHPNSPLLGDNLVRHLAGKHASRVTSLFAPDPRYMQGVRLLISGAQDGRIIVWSMDTLEIVGQFLGHSEPVRSFHQPPPESGKKMSRQLVSIAEDHSIAVISLDEMKILFLFTGHDSRIQDIAWRPKDNFMLVKTKHQNVYVWQLKSGHLDRVLEQGKEALELFSASTIVIHCADAMYEYMSPIHAKRTLSCFPIRMDGRTGSQPPALLVILANVKRLISEIYHSAAPSLAPPTPAHTQTRHLSLPESRRSVSSEVDSEYDRRASVQFDRLSLTHIEDTPEPIPTVYKDTPSRPSTPPPALIITTNSGDIIERPSRSPESSFLTTLRRSRSRSVSVASEVSVYNDADDVIFHSILSGLLTWGIDEEIDEICMSQFGLAPPRPNVSFGMRGAGGYLGILAPQAANIPLQVSWTISPSMTASRLLKIMALTRAVLSMNPGETEQQLNQDVETVLTHYGSVLPGKIGKDYALPSFSYLAKYWQDSVVDIQQAARSIFRTTLSNLDSNARKELVELLKPLISSKVKQGIRSTVILAILGMDNDNALDMETCSKISSSLVHIMKEAPLTMRTTAIDLLGRGFSTWQAHLNGPQLLRQLQQYANFHDESKDVPPMLQSSARQAILRIATTNTPLLIQFLSLDLMHSRTPEERKSCLKLVDVFVNKRPGLFLPHLIRIVEAVVKCLDPNSPTMRENLLLSVTATLHDVVKTFPSVAFHGATQRLVCGTQEGPSVVFDLKTGGRWQVLEGHVQPVKAVAISQDGKIIACATETMLGIWQPATGLFGMITSGGVFTSSSKPTKLVRLKGPVEGLLFIGPKSLRVVGEETVVSI